MIATAQSVVKDLDLSLVRTMVYFLTFFIQLFYPTITGLLECLDPAIYSCLLFAL